METGIGLLVKLKAPIHTEPDNNITTILEIEAVGGTGGMSKKNSYLFIIPAFQGFRVYYFRVPGLQGFKDTGEVVAELVKDKDGVAVGLFDEFPEGFKFGGVDGEVVVLIVVYGSVGKLAELAGEYSGIDGCDLLPFLYAEYKR